MKTLSVSIILLLCVFLFNCGGSGEELIADLTETTDPSSITLRQLQDSSSRVEIPLAVFGEAEEDLTGASFDIELNDTLILQGADPDYYFVELVGLVSFEIHDLVDGDIVTFAFYTAADTSVVYEGTFSSGSDAQAIIIVDD